MSKQIKIGYDDISPTLPSDRTMKLSSTIFLWIAATLVIPTVVTGQMFVPDLSPYDAFGAVIIASLIGCFALAAIAMIGTKTENEGQTENEQENEGQVFHFAFHGYWLLLAEIMWVTNEYITRINDVPYIEKYLNITPF